MLADSMGRGLASRLQLAPTPRDIVWSDGTASLLRFRGERTGSSAPVLLVPSLINRWYVLDLHGGASVVEALVGAGLDVYCLDWGAPEAEDRYLEWDDVLVRLARAMRKVRALSGSATLSLVGYCMGATLAAIAAALDPEAVGGLVNLAGPIDFAAGGMLRAMVDARFFDADAVAEAGNVTPEQMQSGFVALRPTAAFAKWLRTIDPDTSDDARARADALEHWANDNVAFPGAAYRRYIGDLYQKNELVRGEHHVAGRRVELGAIRCPVLTVVADRDAICPPAAALALHAHVGSRDTTALTVPGGHVGAVVGGRAKRELYPRLCQWLGARERGTMRA
jgi:polyhydroxyalkanoate synthase subunit PhaC